MKCKFCQGDVPPKFSHAILVNICPLCGEAIMDDELQIALKSLKEAMAAVISYPQEIMDWLKSNYSLQSEDDVQDKINVAVQTAVAAAELKAKEHLHRQLEMRQPQIKFVQEQAKEEVVLDENGNQISGPSIQPSNQTSKFFKNAQATRVLNQQSHFKDLIKQIKKSGAEGGSGEGGGGVVTPEMAMNMGNELDYEERTQLRAAFGDDSPESDYGRDPADIDYEDEIPSIVLNMASGGKGGGSNVNHRDLQKLQNLQYKSAKAKSEMSKTGSVGLIRR